MFKTWKLSSNTDISLQETVFKKTRFNRYMSRNIIVERQFFLENNWGGTIKPRFGKPHQIRNNKTLKDRKPFKNGFQIIGKLRASCKDLLGEWLKCKVST